MPSALAWIAGIALVLSLGSTFLALWFETFDFDDALAVLSELLSWKVIAGGLVLGAGTTFKAEIGKRLGG